MPDLNARVDSLKENERRAWRAIEALAGKQERLDDALAVLLDAQALRTPPSPSLRRRFAQ